MRHLRFVLIAVVAVAALLILPADELRATPGAGGTLVFSVQGIDPTHDISAAAVPPGVTCTSADVLAAPGTGPVGPCAPRVPPAPALPVPWGATGAPVDLGLNLFGPFTDDLQDFSLGETIVGITDFDFSVGPAPANGGVTVGAPVPPVCAPFPVNVTTEAAGLQAQGDVFTTAGVPPGCNTQFTDEAALGLIAPNPLAPAVAPLDNIDGLGEFTFAGGTCTVVAGTFATRCGAYTLSAASPILGFVVPDPVTLAPVTGASILAQPGTAPVPPALPAGCAAGGVPCVAVPPVLLGLVAGDDIDALCWFDVIPNMVPDLPMGALGPGFMGDIYLYSLTPGSPSAGALGGPASIIRSGGGIGLASVFRTAATLGLLLTDNLDALICHDVDGDLDLVPLSLDNCPTTGNPNQVDSDSDGIGNACDTEGPSPNTNGLGGADDCTDGVDNDGDGLTDLAEPACVVDSDLDGIPDPLDNCPTVFNPGQANVDGDALGDACDTEGPSPNTNGVGGADDCYDGVDNDGDGLTDVPDTNCGDTDADGYSDDAEAGTPVCVGMVNDDNLDDGFVNDGCPPVGAAELLCGDALDNDGDGRVNDGCVAAGALSEGAYSIGTSAVGPCSVGAVPNPSPSWPSDFVSAGFPNSTDRVNILDLTSFLAPVRRYGTRPDAVPPPGSMYSARWDLVPGRGLFPIWIAINDLTALLSGAPGYPPIFGGTRAFNGPVCAGP